MDENLKILRSSLGHFNKVISDNIADVLNCKAGCLALCVLPKLMTIPLLIHPLLIPIHSLLKTQLTDMNKIDDSMK